MFSSTKNMWIDTKDFIRAVLGMTCLLSDVELGQDLTVRKLPPDISIKINQDSYPSFIGATGLAPEKPSSIEQSKARGLVGWLTF